MAAGTGHPRVAQYPVAHPWTDEVEPQKKSLCASERNAGARQQWQQQAREIEAHRFVFVDECGSHTSLIPLYGWAPRSQRAVARVPKNRGLNTTIIAALCWHGVGAAMTLQGAADTLAFELFVQWVLCPSLKRGQIVVWDNLSIHKSVRAREQIEACGCELWFLPTYSPDFNPIELAWSKLKARLRRAGARTPEALQQAIAQALPQITHKDARAWFKHCGYSKLLQPT